MLDKPLLRTRYELGQFGPRHPPLYFILGPKDERGLIGRWPQKIFSKI
jgi:hypothetical protein